MIQKGVFETPITLVSFSLTIVIPMLYIQFVIQYVNLYSIMTLFLTIFCFMNATTSLTYATINLNS